MAGRPWGPWNNRGPFPPLRPGDIRLEMRDIQWGHRYASPHGLQRWYSEMGPPCRCPCRRGLAPDAENTAGPDEHVNGIPAGWRLERLRRIHMKPCPCTECGAWEQGPLRPGESRRFFGCTVVIHRDMDYCHMCPPVDAYEPGLPPPKRVRLAA